MTVDFLSLQKQITTIRDENTEKSKEFIDKIYCLQKVNQMKVAEKLYFMAWDNNLSAREKMERVYRKIQKQLGKQPQSEVVLEAFAILNKLYLLSWQQILDNFKGVDYIRSLSSEKVSHADV